MNTDLYHAIKALVLNAIESGAIDRSRVRQIIVGMSRDGQSIKLWQQECWDDYNDYSDGASLGEITNHAWLDDLDRISFGEPIDGLEEVAPSAYLPRNRLRLTNPKQQDLYERHLTRWIQQIKWALAELATTQALGAFDHLVGLMGLGISNSGYADLIALYHPFGTQLISGKERRLPGYSSAYGEMRCTDEGVLHFYPETDKEAYEDDWEEEEEEEDKPSIEPRWLNHYLFSDMDIVMLSRDDVVFHLHTTDQWIELDSGHTKEEWGEPGREEINEKLIAHFSEQVPHLMFDEKDMPNPSEKAHWENWLSLYARQNQKKPAQIISHALKKDNIEGARQFQALLTLTDKEQASVKQAFCEYYLKKGEYESIVQEIESGVEEQDIRALSRPQLESYYRALLMQGERQKVLALTQGAMPGLKVDDPLYVSNASFHYLAGFLLGQPDASALDNVEEGRRKVDVYQLARALQAYPSDVHRAAAIFKRFLQSQCYTPDAAEHDLVQATELLTLAREYFSVPDKTIVFDADVLARFKSSDIVRLNSEKTYESDWRESKSQACLLHASVEEAQEENPRVSSVLLKTPNASWVRLRDGGVAMLSADSENRPLFQHQIPDIKAEALTIWKDYVFVSEGAELHIYVLDCDPDIAPEKHAHLILHDKNSVRSISVSDKLLAVSSGHDIEIYDTTNLAAPTLIALIQLADYVHGHYAPCSGLLLQENCLYLAVDNLALYAIDLTHPNDPHILSAVALSLHRCHMRATSESLAVYNANEIHFYDIRDPRNISGVALKEGSESFECIFPKHDSSEALSFIIGNRGFFWFEYQYLPEVGIKLINARPLFDVEGDNYERLYDINALIEMDGGYVTFHSDESRVLKMAPMPAYQPWDADVTETVKRHMESWIAEQCQAFHTSYPERIPGLLLLENADDQLGLIFAPQESLPDIENHVIYHSKEGAFEAVSYAVDWEILVGRPLDPVQYPQAILRSEAESADIQYKKQIAQQALKAVSDSDTFKQTVSQRAFLATRFAYQFELFGTVNEDGLWQPGRRALEGLKTLSLSERLDDYNAWNSYASKASEDAELKSELYALGRAGDKGALQVIRRRFEIDTDETMDIFLDVIVNREQYSWMTFLEDYTDREDVKAAYLSVYNRLIEHLKAQDRSDEDWSRALVDAALGLGYQDRKELDPLLDILLHREHPTYIHYDQAARLLGGKSDLAPYGELIQETINGMREGDNRLPAFAELLFKAGIIKPPAGLFLLSTREKYREQHVNKKIGIRSLDRLASTQEDVCHIERMFTTRLFWNQFKERVNEDDLVTPLWPKDIHPEPYPGSWQYFLRTLFEQIEGNQHFEADLDQLIEHLSARLIEGDVYDSDRSLFIALFRMLAESQEQARLSTMIQAAKAHIEVIGEEEFKRLNSLHQQAEITIAWKENQAGNLDTAREITQRLLAEGVQNWNMFFLDARLQWRATGKPETAIEVGTRHLDSNLHGGSGKALLLNLIGCAHDELAQYTEALRYFHEAADYDPDQVLFFNNIAEIHHKTGEKNKALEWAKEAKRRGSKAEIITTILQTESDASL
ncbi:MAG: hypothetical protein H6999_01660 [Hahellaceae bacterium]|nr:hypothetical protein [Hahellaceae bacterium]MCP5168457.1 hypothetical protein [Hahellaceae bacterium]